MKHGKKYVDSFKAIDKAKQYDAPEALELAAKGAKAKFDETIELHIRLGVDSRHADQQVRGAVVLPNGTGKSVKVLVLAKGDKVKEALEAGAHVTHVDASKGMVTWAKENAVSSGLADRPVRWLVDDCVKFVEREIRRGNKYDGIIMDPPSYGRGPKGETWKIEESIFPFVELCTNILSDNPLFFLINSYTTGLQPAVLNYMINTAIVPKFGGKVEAEEIGLPVSSNGLVLPCGASGRWSK